MTRSWTGDGGGPTNMAPTSRLERLTPLDNLFLLTAPVSVRTIRAKMHPHRLDTTTGLDLPVVYRANVDVPGDPTD